MKATAWDFSLLSRDSNKGLGRLLTQGGEGMRGEAGRGAGAVGMGVGCSGNSADARSHPVGARPLETRMASRVDEQSRRGCDAAPATRDSSGRPLWTL